MYKISVMTGSRSDYGLLKNVIIRLKNNDKVDLRLIVSGNHFDISYGRTVDEIIGDGLTEYDKVDVPTCGLNIDGMANATGQAIINFSNYFVDNRPDMLIVLGDRYEAFAACSAAMMQNIMIAHISGGDVTEGAIDDTLRHCMTKMSMLHFVGCQQSANRVIQLGESPERVFNVGEPGVENALSTQFYSRKKLAEELKFEGINNDYALVTFHPATRDGDYRNALNQLEELIAAMKHIENLYYVVTLANADTGGNIINDRWIKAQEECNRVRVFSSLGVVRYLSAMKYCRMVLGNSSSGIVEAPSFKVPTVNIGNRQKGRMMARSVISCNPIENEIIRSINKALDVEFVESINSVVSPFGDGNTSEEIIKKVIEYLDKNRSASGKTFYDIP